MRSVGMVLRAEMVRRWTSWLALTLLITLVGGTVLAGVSSAQRTSSAFAHFTSEYGYDADVYSSAPLPRSYLKSANVTSASESAYYFNGNVRARREVIPYGDVNVEGLPIGRAAPRFKLLAGRQPIGPQDILVGFSMQQRFGLKLGSRIEVPFYSLAQRSAELNATSYLAPDGMYVHFRIVGIDANETDFPSGNDLYTIVTSHAFENGLGRDAASVIDTQVRLRRGVLDVPNFQVYVNHHQNQGFAFFQDDDTATASVAESIQPQATGWWLFALFATLAGLALIGQALSRQSLLERETYPTLSALGLRPRQLFQLGMARAGAIGLAGAFGAVVVAFGASPLTPVGEARIAETSRGFVVDWPELALGALLVVGIVLLLAAIPSWRAATIGTGAATRGRSRSQANAPVALIAKSGAPPSVLVGVRNALDRGRGRTAVPVTTALVGSALAVTALVATTIFGASLTHLLKTPRLYGQNWQLDLGSLTTSQRDAEVATLARNPAVTRITWSYAGKLVEVGNVPVQGVFEQDVKGPVVFSLADGHSPKGSSQIDLGSSTLARVRAHLGSKVRVSLITGSGKSLSRLFKVVGVVTLPASYSSGGLGSGAVLPLRAIELVACPSGPYQKSCIIKLSNRISGWNVEVGVVRGPVGRATLMRFEHLYAQNVNELTVPINLVNFGQAVDFPLLLAVTLALFGAATLGHLLFVSVARRRQQVALLKVLGFVRRQILSATCWQALTVVAIGLAIGMPSGLVIGESVWRTFASHLGAVPVAVFPVSLVAIVCAVIIVGGVALAIVPALLAVRVQPAEALREM